MIKSKKVNWDNRILVEKSDVKYGIVIVYIRFFVAIYMSVLGEFMRGGHR